MEAEDFKKFEGQKLKAKTAEGNQVELTLEKVEHLEAKGVEKVEGVRSKPFALILTGPAQQKMFDQVINIEIGDKEIKVFIKLLNEKEDQIIYESIWN